MVRLTDKQENFVQGLIKGMSQREAYKNAYNCKNMKDETIDKRASELFKNGAVRGRYDELHNKVIAKGEREGLMTATELLRLLNELIVRNLKKDDKTALDGIKTLGKNLNTFTEKIEHSGKIDSTILIEIGEEDD